LVVRLVRKIVGRRWSAVDCAAEDCAPCPAGVQSSAWLQAIGHKQFATSKRLKVSYTEKHPLRTKS
jgi:hypothetical protein